MTLPVGQISLSEVNTELGISPASTLITMNDAAVRTLAGVGGSGTVISMSDLQGKSNTVAIPLTISGNTYNYDVYTNRGPTYSPGNSNITVTINPGVTVGSTSTGTFALTVPSAFSPTDTITIVNNGTIVGRGGNGGAGAPASVPTPGSVAGGGGGTALRILRPTTITNNGTIGGGGGGGGGGGRGGPGLAQGPDGNEPIASGNAGAGGSGGGGAGFDAGSPNGSATAGGAGTAGSVAPGSGPNGIVTGGTGGAGGARGSAGSSGGPGTVTPVGFPITGNNSTPGAGGGGAGAYISGLPFVTWPATGTRLGPSS